LVALLLASLVLSSTTTMTVMVALCRGRALAVNLDALSVAPVNRMLVNNTVVVIIIFVVVVVVAVIVGSSVVTASGVFGDGGIVATTDA
jgi:hypothetical protein